MKLRIVILVVALAAASIYTSVAQAQRVNTPGPVASWLCIHHWETRGHPDPAGWHIVDYPYEGGLQMDRGFQLTYGLDFIREHHGLGAHAWTVREQMIAANRARVGVDWRGSTWPGPRGFGPWPNTRKLCGL